jgi:hypothetical protein
LRLAALANAIGIDLNGVDTRIHVLLTLPWIAAAPPEDFYYPAEVISEVSIPFIPELVARLLQEHAHYEGPRRPARAAKVPGRNDPCPCGSGQKYKRGCAQNTVSPVDLELEGRR